jgi:hypothetical protein
MASGIVSVGLFGATWIAGVVGAVGQVLHNPSLSQVGTVSRMLLPTDGLWRGAMHAFQDPTLLAQFSEAFEGHPFLSQTGLTAAYVAWAVVWVAVILSLAAAAFQRRDV